ncbi:hypothetical protein [Alcanivorax sp.]|uniref:hypothetical protein n=1 Tax=Alcanivorax sp. TaxID=1872427 RepID=UPI0032D95064
MKIKIMTLLASAALAMPAASLAADVPQRGMSQSQVRAEFGAPKQSKGPVGIPAITRWHYDGFTVYFEKNTTLHTVVDRPASAAPDVFSGQKVDALPPIQEKTAAPSSTATPAADSDDEAGGPVFDPVSGRFASKGDSKPEPAPANNETKPDAVAPAVSEAAAATSAPQADKPAESPAQTAPKSEPAAAAPDAEGEFRFDPVTGRIILAGEDTPKQAAQKQAESMEQEARQSANQARESADQAVEDTRANARNAADEASKDVDAAQSQAQQEATKQTEQVEQAAQDVKDAAKDATDDAADGGGFYIDWGARQ